MIREPQLWQLVLEAGASGLHVMAYTPLEEFSLISRWLPYDPAAASPLRALEDAVYENPLLTQPFSRVTVLWQTPRFAVLPDFVTEPEQQAALLRAAVLPDEGAGTAGDTAPGSEAAEVVCDDLGPLCSRLAFEVDAQSLGFLRRTFANPAIHHPLTPSALYFAGKHPQRPRGKMLVNLRPGHTDIVVLGDHAPLLLNSYAVREPLDTCYFVLNARETLRLRDTDEIIIAGENALRMSVSAVLRRYVRYVLPAIFPTTMFRAGRNALSTPFEIIVAPLVL